jgi:hypothetical protein
MWQALWEMQIGVFFAKTKISKSKILMQTDYGFMDVFKCETLVW